MPHVRVLGPGSLHALETMDAHSTPGDYRNKFPATSGCKRILIEMSGRATPQSQDQGYLLLAFAVAASFGLWVLFVASVHVHEMFVGLFATLASIVFCVFVWRCRQRHLKLCVRDLVQGWRIPWYLVSGVVEITWVLFKDVLHVSPAKSLFRVSGFEPSSDPEGMARRVLAVAYTTVAPNFIVLGIDECSHRMLFHQIERSDVPRMTQNLGAKV